MTTKQAFTVFAAIHTLAKKMSQEDQKVLFLDTLEVVVKDALGAVPTIQEQQAAIAEFFLELSHEQTTNT